jgi:hypothetical protein
MMAHALRVTRSSGVVLFFYMAQPDFDDIRLIVGMPSGARDGKPDTAQAGHDFRF